MRGYLSALLKGSCHTVCIPLGGVWLQVLDALQAHDVLGKRLAHPSLSHGANNLYARGIFEEETRPNLARRIGDLVPDEPGGVLLTVNDKKLHAPLRLLLRLRDPSADGDTMQS